MKILLLNLAGPHETATDNTVTGLSSKYTGRDTLWSRLYYGTSEVLRVDVHEAYQEAYAYLDPRNKNPQGGTPKFDQAKRQIDNFLLANTVDKVMLSIHGLVDDVDYGVCKHRMGEELKISHLRLYDFFMMLVGDRYRQKKLKLTLVMCYGARSADYTKSHAAEDLVKGGAPDLTTSYAFKFYSLLCKQMDVIMTARTGALSFDKRTGASKVESEALIANKLALRTLQQQAQGSDPGFMELYGLPGDDVADVLQEILESKQVALQRIDQLQGVSGTQRRVMRTAYMQFLVENTKERESKGKYGKVVFEYANRRVSIKVKYASDGTKISQQVATKQI